MVSLDTYGRVYSLGEGGEGGLGLGDVKDRLKVCEISDLEERKVIDVTCGYRFTAFLTIPRHIEKPV
jgi:alpha-tubulin suppressor-like RCC1 family protein